jgi:hypothetical protein
MSKVKKTEIGIRLRQLADWFDKHPEVPVPSGLKADSCSYYCYLYAEEFKEALPKLGAFKKVYNEYDFEAVIEVAGFKIAYYTSRENVCTKKVVSKKFVPEVVVPQRIIAAHEEDVIEWECGDSLLAPHVENF